MFYKYSEDELERRIILNLSQLMNATFDIQRAASEENWKAMDEAIQRRLKCQKVGNFLKSKLEKGD